MRSPYFVLRRSKMPLFLVVVAMALGAAIFFMTRLPVGERTESSITPADPATALTELRAGNGRFVNSARTRTIDTTSDDVHRRMVAQGQHPFAAILCCADSRVCPEIIFDQQTGSVFEIRNAGNVVDDDVLASLEYAVEHFHVPVVLVMGHKSCGAIDAVCEADDKPLHDHVHTLQERLAGIVSLIQKSDRKDILEFRNSLCAENARQQALKLLDESAILKAAQKRGELSLVYGLYDMETGSVSMRVLD